CGAPRCRDQASPLVRWARHWRPNSARFWGKWHPCRQDGRFPPLLQLICICIWRESGRKAGGFGFGLLRSCHNDEQEMPVARFRHDPLPPTFNRLAWSNLAAQSAEQVALAAAPIVAVLMLGVGEGRTGALQT